MVRKRQRLNRAEDALQSIPVHADLLQEAFAHFCETGELPEEKRLAWAVCKQALNGGKPVRVYIDRAAAFAHAIRVAMEAADRGEAWDKPKEMSVRERLFDEAVYAPEVLSYFAREVLKIRIGFLEEDPTDPNWLVGQPLPDCPGIGLFMLGFPQRLARPPYEEQAERLFARLADLRGNRIDHDDPAWQPTLEAALRDAEESGVFPAAGLMQDAVLALMEMQALISHSAGEDVAALMAALDRAARANDDERGEAIACLQDLIRAGYLADRGVRAHTAEARRAEAGTGSLTAPSTDEEPVPLPRQSRP